MIIADALRDTEDRHEMTKHSISLSLPPPPGAHPPPPFFPWQLSQFRRVSFKINRES